MALLDISANVWHEALGFSSQDRPDALILEGTWWRKEAETNRLALLDNVRETAFPEIYLGEYEGATIAYCCAYGAPRAVEPTHIFTQMGTPLVIQIGTCGALDPALSAGAVMVPDQGVCRDGVSQHYGADSTVQFDADWNIKARQQLETKKISVESGRHLTWPSLFAQSDAMCSGWHDDGLRSVDMEATAVAAVAQKFGASAIALLSVWDALPEGKTFLDPLDADAAAALRTSNRIVFDVALELARDVKVHGGKRNAF